jgi:8-oxo-dGTP pyrophosphatase MutT (NUDIX family)
MQFPPCGYRLSAKALIVSKKGLLMVREHTEFWDLPGGGVEHFEDPLFALQREIKEELGADIASAGHEPVHVWPLFDRQYKWPLLFLLYPTRLRSGFASNLSDIDVRFVSQDELQTWPIEPYLEERRNDLRRLTNYQFLI